MAVCVCVQAYRLWTPTNSIAAAAFIMSQGGSRLIGADWRAQPNTKLNLCWESFDLAPLPHNR